MKEYLITPGVIAVISVMMILLPASALVYSFQGQAFFAGDFYRILSFPFVHVNFAHLAQNMAAILITAALAYELAFSAFSYSLIFSAANMLLAVVAIFFFPQTYLAGASFGVYAVMGGLGLQKNPYLSRKFLFAVLLATLVIGSLTMSKSTNFHILGFGIGTVLFLLTNKKRPQIFATPPPQTVTNSSLFI